MILQGDCLVKLKELPENSVDAIVTDPPYGLEFMGKDWDKGVPGVHFWQEMIRVLKPGGHLLAFSGTRTYHRMASAIEDAGFEIRDMIEWVYGSGFPKSLNIGKAVDKLQGNGREVVGKDKGHTGERVNNHEGLHDDDNYEWKGEFDVTKGTSEWEGWGTALKPAHEPICLARKPLSEKTVAENVLKYGTGGINIDGTRVPLTGSDPNAIIDLCQCDHSKSNAQVADKKSIQREATNSTNQESFVVESVDTNTLERKHGTPQEDTSKETILCLDEMSAENTTTSLNTFGSGRNRMDQSQKDTKSTISTENIRTTDLKTCSACGKPTTSNTTGNLGRFPSNFIHDNSEEVRECFPETGSVKGRQTQYSESDFSGDGGWKGEGIGQRTYDGSGNASRFFKSIVYVPKASKSERGSDNNHPTVKPIALMEYLIKMVTPKGGVVLDPFAGSGSTLVAAKQSGFQYIGIEKEEEYVKIINARLATEVLSQEVLF